MSGVSREAWEWGEIHYLSSTLSTFSPQRLITFTADGLPADPATGYVSGRETTNELSQRCLFTIAPVEHLHWVDDGESQALFAGFAGDLQGAAGVGGDAHLGGGAADVF